jgi:succinyl-diaminopimelate desuccinylase
MDTPLEERESETLSLARALMRRPSVTPDDQGCQELLIERLEAVGFEVTRLRFGEVDNFWARRGSAKPLVCFAGHTDVVPTGPVEQWRYPPFEARVVDGVLHGRGAADMKGSLAAMITGVAAFFEQHPEPAGSVAFLVTSDEEGRAKDGTKRVVEWLEERGEKIDYCLVGEPSSTARVGDIIKNGRRGSLSGRLTVHGIQGHVAYPQNAENPIHAVAPLIAKLAEEVWDQGNDCFPPTSFQVSNIQAGTGANNVIPGSCQLRFNFRYCTEQTAEGLKQRMQERLDAEGLKTTLDWTFSGAPFLTADGPLIDAVLAAVRSHGDCAPELSTSGGTSDGRFIAPTGAAVVELGPVNATIHKVDEEVSVADLERLSSMYRSFLSELLID